MKKSILALTVLLGATAVASAQTPYKVLTHPKLPARDSLERMNLTLAWNTRVTIDGGRDAVFSVQILPGKRTQILVQTFKGAAFLYDGDNGDLIWKATNITTAYWTPQAAAFNSHSIFVTRRNFLYVLNRFDGMQRVYTYNAFTKQTSFGYELSFTPNAPLVADEDILYVPMGNRLHTFLMPDFDAIEKAFKRARERTAKEGGKDAPGSDIQEGLDSPEPRFYWGFGLADQLMTSAPLLFGPQVSILTTDGALTSVKRYETGPRDEYFQFKAKGQSPAAAGQHQYMAYLGSDDFNLYAIDMRSGKLKWRYISGAPITQQPEVNDRDVFVAPERGGLRRIERETGREVWINRDASRFLAANESFIYALDRNGKFFILDARRGGTLSKLDLSDWAIAVPNEWTDRIYLAANDGQVMCLRHRDLTKPLQMKSLDVQKVVEEKKPIDEKKPMEEKKPMDEKKDEKKDDKDKAADKVGHLTPALHDTQFAAGYDRPAWEERRTWARR